MLLFLSFSAALFVYMHCYTAARSALTHSLSTGCVYFIFFPSENKHSTTCTYLEE
jgi:hypothetical protein